MIDRPTPTIYARVRRAMEKLRADDSDIDKILEATADPKSEHILRVFCGTAYLVGLNDALRAPVKEMNPYGIQDWAGGHRHGIDDKNEAIKKIIDNLEA